MTIAETWDRLLKLQRRGWPDSSGIHPHGRNRDTSDRKRRNWLANQQARAEANRQHSFSLTNPTWHGIGRHAGVRIGH